MQFKAVKVIARKVKSCFLSNNTPTDVIVKYFSPMEINSTFVVVPSVASFDEYPQRILIFNLFNAIHKFIIDYLSSSQQKQVNINYMYL